VGKYVLWTSLKDLKILQIHPKSHKLYLKKGYLSFCKIGSLKGIKQTSIDAF